MKKFLKSFFPRLYKFQQECNQRRKEHRLFLQRLVQIKCGSFDIEAPEKHPLIEILKTQPYRDVCVGIAAKYLSAKYPGATMVDIGANIGDTAAIIATQAKNPLVLVEASDYFFNILSRNAARIPNVRVVKKVLISDGVPVSGTLRHWGGTASFQERADAPQPAKTQRLSEVAGDDACFVKIDTDGFDFKIVKGSLDWLRRVQPGCLFECQIRDNKELADAGALLEGLEQAGYAGFTVWDDRGLHMVSTTSLEVLKDLTRYLFKNSAQPERRTVANYDILFLAQKDADVHENIRDWYKTH